MFSDDPITIEGKLEVALCGTIDARKHLLVGDRGEALSALTTAAYMIEKALQQLENTP